LDLQAGVVSGVTWEPLEALILPVMAEMMELGSGFSRQGDPSRQTYPLSGFEGFGKTLI